MVKFDCVHAAREHAKLGGQALFVGPASVRDNRARGASKNGIVAYVFDCDLKRLKTTAELVHGGNPTTIREWRSGWEMFCVSVLGRHALHRSLRLCHSRILRRTIKPWEDPRYEVTE